MSVARHIGLPVVAAIAYYTVLHASSSAAENFVATNILPLFDGIVVKSKIPFFILAIAFIFTHITKLPVYAAQSGEGRGYDNKKPRDQQTRLKGWGFRALSAYQNAFEAFPPFGIAVLAAHLAQVPIGVQINLTVLWLVCRIAYTFFYISNIFF